MDNPGLSNREIARQIGVSETTIRYWKKSPIWTEERQKLINDRAEMMELNMDDPLKACSVAVKSGAHIQAKAAMQGVSAYIAIMNHLHQFHILIEYFENLEEEED